MTNQGLDQLNKLAEEVGNFIQYWGFKKIHGKIWTHLYLSSEPLDAADLQKRLNISKSLASISLTDLLQYNVILKRGKGPKDTTVYVCNPEIRTVIIDVLKKREAQILENIQGQFSTLQQTTTMQPEEAINVDRVQSLGSMIGEAQQGLAALVELKSVDFSTLKLGSNALKVPGPLSSTTIRASFTALSY